jgi:hypothetical protein
VSRGEGGRAGFDARDLFPRHAVNSEGGREPFELGQIARSLRVETGLDPGRAQVVADAAVKKLLQEGKREVETSHIRELVCSELVLRGLDKEKELFSLERRRFHLDPEFLGRYEGEQPDWGPLGYITYKRTYSRLKDDGTKEEFWETLKRVVEGCYSIQKTQRHSLDLPWDEGEAQRSAQRMYEKAWNFKFLPPGRGLWIMGTEFVRRHGSMALNNCAFVSTENIATSGPKPFLFMMDALMLGVGVGFDTEGAGEVAIKEPEPGRYPWKVPDSREGWVEGLRRLLEAFLEGKRLPEWDYSLVRPKGSRIKGFGGVASGPEPLDNLYRDAEELLRGRVGEPLRSVDIVDLMNFVGRCVVAGNVRRSAQIALGDPGDGAYVSMKDPEEHAEELRDRRWASNNSVVVDPDEGFDYSRIAGSIAKNGEPGVVWLKNSRRYSRMDGEPDWKDRDVAGVNPCGEQSLESYELCVRGDTRLQTRHGCYSIADLDGEAVEVWNGEEWSETTVQMTSPDAELVRVHFSDGSYLDCTRYHRFSAREEPWRDPVEKAAEDLERGDRLPSWSLGEIGSASEPCAYEYGLMIGDGYIDKNKHYEWPMLSLHTDTLQLRDDPEIGIRGTWYKEQESPLGHPYARVNMKDYLDLDRCRLLRKRDGLEDWVFELDRESILQFVAGWIDTDGTLSDEGNTAHYNIYGSEQNIRDLQLLLRRVGIDHATVNLNREKGQVVDFWGRKQVRKKDVWYCLIPSYECAEIPTRLKRIPPEKIGSRYGTNNAHPDGAPIDRARKQKVERVEELGVSEPVYCLNEPERHRCVFGNMLTYQCTLVETFPSRHGSWEEYRETLKYAYLYAKSVTLMRTHWKESNAIMLKNRRIGCSMSGIVDAFARHGRRELLQWCQRGYERLRELDREFSSRFCVPRSVKITTVKPSGTTSLLPGVSAGIHYPHSQHYIRRIRIAANSPLVPLLREAGYPMRRVSTGERAMVAAEFPIREEPYERGKKEVSLEMQVLNAVDLQRYWSDNQVSITVSFKPGEAGRLPDVLEMCEDKLKSISLLPLAEHGYELAPYEEISEEEYERRAAGLDPIDFSSYSARAEGVRGCDSESCELPPRVPGDGGEDGESAEFGP